MQKPEHYRIFYGAAPPDLEKVADRVEKQLKKLPDPEYHKVLNILAYRHPWRPKHSGWINVLDQVLHMVHSAAVLLPVFLWPSFFTAGLSGFLLGVIREWEQWKEVDLKILIFWDRLQDVLFFTLAGILIYGIKILCCG